MYIWTRTSDGLVKRRPESDNKPNTATADRYPLEDFSIFAYEVITGIKSVEYHGKVNSAQTDEEVSMKQPVMVIPPAQAEALYDTALEEEYRGRTSFSTDSAKAIEDWDDGSMDRSLTRRSFHASPNAHIQESHRL